jgi:hypothetical protein
MGDHGSDNSALRIAADTGPWLMPVQYERKAWPKATPNMKQLSAKKRIFSVQKRLFSPVFNS